MSALEDIQLKLDRAESHLDGLSNEIREVVESHSPRIEGQHNELDDTDTAIVTNVPEVRCEWGVALGDFLHNTRSALDHLVSALVVASGGTVTNRHQFPICDAVQQWQSRVAQPSFGSELVRVCGPRSCRSDRDSAAISAQHWP